MRLNTTLGNRLKSQLAVNASALLHLLFPQLCILCWRENPVNGDRLCIDCMLEMPFTVDFDLDYNNVTKHFFGRVPLAHGGALLNYYEESNLTEMLHRFKYKNKTKIGVYLGHRMAKKIVESPKFDQIDLIIPVPLHAKKQRQRGYNQSKVIADAIGEKLLAPVCNTAITKAYNNASQTRKTRLERLENVSKAFQLVDKSQIKGRSVLLVDDVVTTGATLEACCLEVLRGKPKALYVVCAAVAR